MSVNKNESSNSHSDIENIDTQVHIDGCPYLAVHQSCENWENLYPFLFFSSKNGRLCILCSEYGEYDEFWRTKGAQQGQHPNHKFSTYGKSKKHKRSLEMCRKEMHSQKRKCLQTYLPKSCNTKPENKNKKETRHNKEFPQYIVFFWHVKSGYYRKTLKITKLLKD